MRDDGGGMPTPAGARERWVAAENARRRADHEAQLARWRKLDEELATLVRTAAQFAGRDPDEAAGHQVLDAVEGERVFGVLPGLALVEVRRAAGEYGVGYGAYSAVAAATLRGRVASGPVSAAAAAPELAAAEEARQLVDQGTVTVTNQRVVFQGANEHREWPFVRLVGIEHAADAGVTLLHDADRPVVSGLAASPERAPSVRFTVVLAFAHFRSAVDRFVEQLEREREEHAGRRPAPPELARPEDMPWTAGDSIPARLAGLYLGRPGQPPPRRALQVGGAFLATAVVALVGAAALGLIRTNNAASPADSSQPRAAGASPSGSSVRTPRLPGPAPQLSEVMPTPSDTSGPPTTTPASSSQSPSPTGSATSGPELCNAPPNPYGYNLCGRGELIYSPAPDTCSYLNCVANFGTGSSGYLVQCRDGLFSSAGGLSKACASHGGVLRPVYSGP